MFANFALFLLPVLLLLALNYLSWSCVVDKRPARHRLPLPARNNSEPSVARDSRA